MRKIILVFCAYMLVLSVLPCHDGVECSEIRTEAASSSHDHSSDNELCPPFCACACCGVQVVQLQLPTFFQTAFTPEYFVDRPTFYNPVFPSEIAISIWQPPKIG